MRSRAGRDCTEEFPQVGRDRRSARWPARDPRRRAHGALCYIVGWDARRAKLFDRCAAKDGIQPFDALVDQFMSIEPYMDTADNRSAAGAPSPQALSIAYGLCIR